MKQQQILAIALVLLVQQVYFFTAVNSANAGVPDPASPIVTTKNDTPATTTPVPEPTTSSSPATTASTPITPTSTTVPPPTTASTPPPTTPPPTTPPTTTIQPPPTTPATTTTTSAPKPPQLPRHFDLPSFIGGIVLTIGLIGIGFVAHKIYKSKFDRNYHTL